MPPALPADVRIKLEDARKTALTRVPGGRIQSEELEREKGRLIYSFDIKLGKKPGFEEIAVDAITGAVVEQKHETARAEKAEAKAEKKKDQTPKP